MDAITLFKPDLTKPSGRLVFGNSGSGKSYFLTEMLHRAFRSKEFGPQHRFVIIDPKHEMGSIDGPTVHHAANFPKAFERDRIVYVHPELGEIESMLDMVTDLSFMAADELPEFSATIVFDEFSMIATPQKMSESAARLFTQGRSKRIAFVAVSQRPVIHRISESQSAYAVLFRGSRVDNDRLKEKWGIKPDELDAILRQKQFSFGVLDLTEDSLTYFAPI